MLYDGMDASFLYFSVNLFSRKCISSILSEMGAPLCPPKGSTRGAADFEICTIVYRIGAQQSMTILHEERDGQVSASSNPIHTQNCYTALLLALQSLRTIEAKQKQAPPRAGVGRDKQTKVTWGLCEQQNEHSSSDSTLTLYELQDLISIVLPLSLAGPRVGDHLELLITSPFLSPVNRPDDVILQFEPQNFQANFTLYRSLSR